MTRKEAIAELSSNQALSIERILELRKILVDTEDEYTNANSWYDSNCYESQYMDWNDSGCIL